MNKNYPIYQTTFIDDMRALVEEAAQNFGESTAISYKDNPWDKEVKKVSFSQWRNDVRDLGTALVSYGLREEKIAIVGENSYGWCCAFFGAMAIGSVTVPVDKELPLDDIDGIISTTACKAVFFGKTSESKIKEILANGGLKSVELLISIAPESKIEADLLGEKSLKSISEVEAAGAALYAQGDNSYYDYKIDVNKLASIVFTSGTTGKGKGVMLSQANICLDMTLGMYNFDITRKTLHVLPPHHTFGSTVNYVGHLSQGCEVYISSGLKYVSDEIKEQQPTHLILVPAFLEVMNRKIWATARKGKKEKLLKVMMKVSDLLRKMGIDVRRKLFGSVLSAFGGKLELIICGGAKLDEDIIRTFDSLGITILNGYGITECAPLISANRNKYRKAGSVGTPILACRVKIDNPDENGEGEICVKGPNVMLGYYNNPEATAEVFDKDGFFHTGDYGKLDEEGWIYITGRKKNLIILSNGKNVYPEEIEADLQKVEGVSEVVVYAGESRLQKDKITIVAEIFPDADLLADKGISNAQEYFETQVKLLNAKMPSYKAVKHVKLRDCEFQKNTSRKITRFNIDKTID
ncbi:MAG: AMP-binding protein [Bacteroidales bacterium]|nr:AMP-binding protein [Bacteroidales bacterium]MBQ5604376.1 AMP-binding protein [Bacteroidales bacterium]MBR0452838.1 AMP-binding protein [Bacteroidales bacterium]